jgi:proteasome lid subunit RPN8/RPN11
MWERDHGRLLRYVAAITVVIKKLRMTADHAAQIRRDGAREYPHECCGIILGRDEKAARLVTGLRSAANEYSDSAHRRYRFAISPLCLLRAEKDSAERGESVLGFYHSHPDHPPRPSEFDREHAWPFYSYVIVEVKGGTPGEIRSWQLNDSSKQFIEQELVIEKETRP